MSFSHVRSLGKADVLVDQNLVEGICRSQNPSGDHYKVMRTRIRLCTSGKNLASVKVQPPDTAGAQREEWQHWEPSEVGCIYPASNIAPQRSS